jgi:hypothetical protein
MNSGDREAERSARVTQEVVDHLHHVRESPVSGGNSARFGLSQQFSFSRAELLPIRLPSPSNALGTVESLDSSFFPVPIPTTNAFPAHIKPPCDFGLLHSIGEECSCFHSSLSEFVESSCCLGHVHSIVHCAAFVTHVVIIQRETSTMR